MMTADVALSDWDRHMLKLADQFPCVFWDRLVPYRVAAAYFSVVSNNQVSFKLITPKDYQVP